MCDKVSDVVNLGGIRAGRAVLDLKVFGFGHHRKQSEIEVNRKFTWGRRDIHIVSA